MFMLARGGDGGARSPQRPAGPRAGAPGRLAPAASFPGWYIGPLIPPHTRGVTVSGETTFDYSAEASGARPAHAPCGPRPGGAGGAGLTLTTMREAGRFRRFRWCVHGTARGRRSRAGRCRPHLSLAPPPPAAGRPGEALASAPPGHLPGASESGPAAAWGLPVLSGVRERSFPPSAAGAQEAPQARAPIPFPSAR